VNRARPALRPLPAPGTRYRRCMRTPALALAAGLAIMLMGVAGCRAPAAASASPPVPPLAAELGLDADEVAAIVSHGPWPPPRRPDPSNRVSGDPAAIELGRRLFDDPRPSADGRRRCSDCHRAELAFADGRARPPGADGLPLDRNAQGLLDARLHHWFGWDGGADSLWSFVLRPLADPREIGTDDPRLAALFAADPTLACLRRAAFGEPVPAGTALRVQVAKALAAFIETLDSPRTPFDALRDALASADPDAAARTAARAYPADALRGLRRFVGDARCALCHVGPAFTHGEFHDAGRPFMAAPGRPDPGRHGGIAALRADPFNRLGPWSDAPPAQAAPSDAAVRTRHVEPSHRNFGEFRVPGLRALAHTAPYGHDGSMKTLDDVITHYSEIDIERLHADGEAVLRPLRLDAGARAELHAFLSTLSVPLPALARGASGASAVPGAVPPGPSVTACLVQPGP
jgi:cytochrome c peroxidase